MNTEILTDVISGNITFPEVPEMPTTQWGSILNLWDFSDSALEITAVFQNFFSRIPPYFLAYFALSFFFIIVALIMHLIARIM